jgi:hypothetical protein
LNNSKDSFADNFEIFWISLANLSDNSKIYFMYLSFHGFFSFFTLSILSSKKCLRLKIMLFIHSCLRLLTITVWYLSIICKSNLSPRKIFRRDVAVNLRDLLILPMIVHTFSTSTSSHGPFSGTSLKLYLFLKALSF